MVMQWFLKTWDVCYKGSRRRNSKGKEDPSNYHEIHDKSLRTRKFSGFNWVGGRNVHLGQREIIVSKENIEGEFFAFCSFPYSAWPRMGPSVL